MTLNTADFTPEDTLIAIMIAVSASDDAIRTSELVTIERMVNHLPVFANYDVERIKEVSNAVFDMLAPTVGLGISNEVDDPEGRVVVAPADSVLTIFDRPHESAFTPPKELA